MKNPARIALLMAVAAAGFLATTPAAARGGAANLMNSPGYQRALEESRKRYRDSYSQPYVHSRPYTQPRATYPGKKWRHRGRR